MTNKSSRVSDRDRKTECLRLAVTTFAGKEPVGGIGHRGTHVLETAKKFFDWLCEETEDE